MSQYARPTLLPLTPGSTRGEVVPIGRLQAPPRLPNQSPFHVINGVAYPRDGFFSIDCVISLVCSL